MKAARTFCDFSTLGSTLDYESGAPRAIYLRDPSAWRPASLSQIFLFDSHARSALSFVKIECRATKPGMLRDRAFPLFSPPSTLKVRKVCYVRWVAMFRLAVWQRNWDEEKVSTQQATGFLPNSLLAR